MKSFMQKALAFTVVIFGWAVTIRQVQAQALVLKPIDQINGALDSILSQVRDERTAATLIFKKLDMDEKQVNDVDVGALFSKKSVKENNNFFELQIPSLKYFYNKEGIPVVKGAAQLTLNLVKAFSQETLNDLAPEVAHSLQEYAENALDKFGKAASVAVDVNELKKNKDTNDVVSLKLHFKASINVDALPAEVKSEAPFRSVDLQLYVNLEGGELSGEMLMNKEYSSFQHDEKGLREWVQGLLDQKEDSYGDIKDMFFTINANVNRLVEEEN